MWRRGWVFESWDSNWRGSRSGSGGRRSSSAVNGIGGNRFGLGRSRSFDTRLGNRSCFHRDRGRSLRSGRSSSKVTPTWCGRTLNIRFSRVTHTLFQHLLRIIEHTCYGRGEKGSRGFVFCSFRKQFVLDLHVLLFLLSPSLPDAFGQRWT